jgi:hypothetical protein
MSSASLVDSQPRRIVLGHDSEDGGDEMLLFFNPLGQASGIFEDALMGNGGEDVELRIVSRSWLLVLFCRGVNHV